MEMEEIKMKITKVNLQYSNNNINNFICEADVTFDYDFTVHGIKVMNGEKGIYLLFPQNGKYTKFVAYPIKEETRQYILDEILKEMVNRDGQV